MSAKAWGVAGLSVAALSLFCGRGAGLSLLSLRNRLKGRMSAVTADKPRRAWCKDCDPALASEVSWFWCRLDMIKWWLLSHLGRRLMPVLYPPPNLCYFDVRQHPGVEGLVALTVDDCFCRQGQAHSLIGNVRALLAEHAARATFFMTSGYSEGWRRPEIEQVVADGHELANHLPEDREYDLDPLDQFEAALKQTNRDIQSLCPGKPVRWFRAPSGNVSPGMLEAVERNKMAHVMIDCYANDPYIPHPGFLASCMLRGATHGSILVMHMPEKGFREWEFELMRLLLVGLQAKGLRSVTMTELAEHAVWTPLQTLGS